MNYELSNKSVSNSDYMLRNEGVVQTGKMGSVLEQIASSYTKMPGKVSKPYNIDNCSCPSCGCLQGNLLLVLSPAGVASATTIALTMGAIE